MNGYAKKAGILVAGALAVVGAISILQSFNTPSDKVSGRSMCSSIFGMASTRIDWNWVKSKIDEGVDVNHRCYFDGGTVLYYAAYFGETGMVRFWLEEEDADPLVKTHDGNTVLHAAAWSGNAETFRLLLEEDMDPLAKNTDGNTVLHYAVWSGRGNAEIVRILLEEGADPLAKNKKGDTVLHSAVNGRNEETIRILLEEGADPLAKNNSGGTPLSESKYKKRIQHILREAAGQ